MRQSIHRFAPSQLFVVAVALTAIGLPPRGAAQIPQNSEAAKDAQYTCDTSGSQGIQLARARELGGSHHDRNKLACAADLLYLQATVAATDARALREAMEAHVVYIEQVQIERDLDFIGVQTAEWNARLQHADGQVITLAQSAARNFPSDTDLEVLRAQTDLLVHRYDDPVDYVKATKRAIPLLSDTASRAPAGMDGRALVCLGKLYLDLPTIFGGSTAHAIELLERARAVDLRDSQRLSYLANAYEQEGKSAEAVKTLTQLLAVEPRPDTRQLVADAWMTGIGVADRLHDGRLQASFEKRRQMLLASHPELLTRARTAVGGHGGEDPLTGKRQY